VYAFNTQESSAAAVFSKLRLSASKAANNIVVSSATKKTALDAIQNVGHGEELRSGASGPEVVGGDSLSAM
jgi:hypothetical protein